MMYPRRRDVFLKIEPLTDYSPLAPLTCARHYGRDCMFNPGHESGRIPSDEILRATVDALVYREYLDPDFTIPNTAKIIPADINEPPWDRRIPGAVLYAKPGEQLLIHVLNGDEHDCHSLHMHGLRYGIDSDGSWPFGIASRDHTRRSDEILPGQRWTYVFEARPETIGAWAFHDHVRNVQRNVNRGLFGGLVVRDPSAPCADHEVPLFVHLLAGAVTGTHFESPLLSPGGPSFSFTFGSTPEVVNYFCRIHGSNIMTGQVQVVVGGPAAANVSMHDNRFDPPMATIGPAGTATWTNNERNANHNHIVFAPGGGTPSFCLNGRAYVGNTPTIVADTGERLRWYVFNLDLGDVWHNFHPHSARWQLPVPPGGAADVHSLSPSEAFVTDTEVPPALRLPCALEDLQCDPPEGACRVRLKGDFLVHCHLEEHLMAGLAGLVRTRQDVWITEDVVRQLPVELPYDDGLNECPTVDVNRCQPEPPVMGIRQPEGPRPPADPQGGTPGDMEHGTGQVEAAGADAAMRGIWELLPCDSQVLAIHAALLRTGKVLFVAGSGNSPERILDIDTNNPDDPLRRVPRHPFRSAVWDYEDGTFKQLLTPTDVFCMGHSFLSDGRLLAAGGTLYYDEFQGERAAYLFDPSLEEFVRVGDMADGRWYPSLATLGDGRILAVSGFSAALSPPPNGKSKVNSVPEVYSEGGGWTTLPALPLPQGQDWPLYPHLLLLRDGRIFYTGGSFGGTLPPLLWDLATNTSTVLQPPTDAARRGQSASVLLPPAQAQKVLLMGGGDPATNAVDVIDLSVPNPAYTPAAPMHVERMHLNAVLLPDRTVFVSGGGLRNEADPQLDSEVYDPSTNAWMVAARATVPRLYHSVALLLPDGRVITAGSNPLRRDEELRLELFHPPYLFRGPRPFIESMPQELSYGGRVDIHTPQAEDIKWAQLIRPTATTHSWDMEQRLVDLPIGHREFCKLSVTVPNEQNLAPPGWYMLFITNRQGVPSVAKFVHLAHRWASGGLTGYA